MVKELFESYIKNPVVVPIKKLFKNSKWENIPELLEDCKRTDLHDALDVYIYNIVDDLDYEGINAPYPAKISMNYDSVIFDNWGYGDEGKKMLIKEFAEKYLQNLEYDCIKREVIIK